MKIRSLFFVKVVFICVNLLCALSLFLQYGLRGVLLDMLGLSQVIMLHSFLEILRINRESLIYRQMSQSLERARREFWKGQNSEDNKPD